MELVDHEGRLTTPPIQWRPGDTVPAPLRFYNGFVLPMWVDYNHHMTEAAYLSAVGWASDALFSYIGDDDAYRAAGHSFYTVETHIAYRREAAQNDPIHVTTQVLGVDRKRLHISHEMFLGHHPSSSDAVDSTHQTAPLLCTCEQMLVHVDTVVGRSAAIPDSMKAALDAICVAHQDVSPAAQPSTVPRHFSLT